MSYCHPTHAQRTKCVCGRVVNLSGAVGARGTYCQCGIVHSKVEGSAFAEATHAKPSGALTTGSRRGGRKGCSGEPIV